jgi:5'-3' exonuclease
MIQTNKKMGIPSYFRRILQKFPGVLSRSSPPQIKALCFDFNCLIYRCIRAPGMPVYTEEQHDDWEKCLLREVCKTVKEVWVVSGRPKQVYIAVDGVVPMAKIRQQRVRRFKSVWLRKQETNEGGWDSNSITPGTAFMDKLEVELQKLASEHRGWEVSGVNEPGEGEHKILRWLREGKLRDQGEQSTCGEKGNVLVYGLDADLILLTMLASQQLSLPIWLIREKQEFSGGVSHSSETQEYSFMNIAEFQERLGVKGKEQTLNYIALMSLMGNDFLPHSVTHKLSDDGHEYVMSALRSGVRLVNSKGEFNVKAFQELCKVWSNSEEEKMQLMINKKHQQAGRGVLQGMKENEGLPLQWNEENGLLNERGMLLNNWRTLYWNWIHTQGRVDEYVSKVCSEYVYGCQWILDYYSGKEVDSEWMFPSWIPPLWSDLAGAKIQVKENVKREFYIQPQEQLAMVLPVESWKLIRNPSLKTLPEQLPQFWPESFGFFSFGRTWLWQCEALVPPLRVERVRAILK